MDLDLLFDKIYGLLFKCGFPLLGISFTTFVLSAIICSIVSDPLPPIELQYICFFSWFGMLMGIVFTIFDIVYQNMKL